MEDNFNLKVNGRQPQFQGEWKTTIILWQKEDDLNVFVNERRPQCIFKWKTTSVSYIGVRMWIQSLIIIARPHGKVNISFTIHIKSLNKPESQTQLMLSELSKPKPLLFMINSDLTYKDLFYGPTRVNFNYFQLVYIQQNQFELKWLFQNDNLLFAINLAVFSKRQLLFDINQTCKKVRL